MPICPLIALSASAAASGNAKTRGFADLAHLLYPFTTHNVTVNEPSTNQSVSSQLRIDLRDISKDGHLLTLSVLPHVLFQALKSSDNVDDGVERLLNALHRWAEPSENEALGAYVACVFAVSTSDEHPLSELSKLIQNQQTLNSPTATSIIPPHCCPPRWTSPSPHILKHYILVDDGSEKAESTFSQMCTTYGKDNCQLLTLSSDARSLDKELEHKWDEVDLLEQLLRKGLDEARAHASSTATSSAQSTAVSTPLQSSVSVISSALPSVSTVTDVKVLQSKPSFDEERKFTKEDANNCNEVVKRFVTAALIPHVERLLRQLQDQVNARRGIISKSFTSSMKKLFTGSASQNTSSGTSVYDWDSVEMQTRRLADLGFLFGLYSLAYQQYRVVKKDFNSDQSVFAHAVASEMCAYALFLAQPTLNSKQFPLHYIESAVGYLTTATVPFPSVLRCAFHTAQVQEHLEQHKEAALNLSRLTCLDEDFLVAAAQAEAAEQFIRANMGRKAAFFRVLAANRFSTANIPELAFDCYRLAMPNFDPINWGVMDEHVSLKILTEGAKTAKLLTPQMALECARRLMTVCSKSTGNTALVGSRVAFIVRVLAAYTEQNQFHDVDNLLQIDANQTEVICGNLPDWSDVNADNDADISHDQWTDVQRAAHHALHGAGAPFRGVQHVSNAHTQNEKVRETPAGELFRLRVRIRNPLLIPVRISQVHLEVDVTSDSPPEESYSLGLVPEVIMNPKQTVEVELEVSPRPSCKRLTVSAVRFNLHGEESTSVPARIPMKARGRRLNRTMKEQKTKTYAPDERLTTTVAATSWPLLSVTALKKPMTTTGCFCDQAHRYLFEMENVGSEAVVRAALATNGYDCVAAGVLGDDGARILIDGQKAASSDKVRVFQLTSTGGPLLEVGQKMRIFIDVRAPSEECLSILPPLLKDQRERSAVILILNYCAASGASRQWQKVVKMTCRKMVSLDAAVLDESKQMISIRVRNLVQTTDAALSRIQLLRLRLVRPPFQDGPLAAVNDISSRKVELESDQSETLCLSLNPSESDPIVWLTEKAEDQTVVDWPAPTTSSEEEDSRAAHLKYHIGILWRANIVNNEGSVRSLIGESFVLNPLYTTVTSRSVKEQVFGTLLHVDCAAPKTVSHDFGRSRLCELPVRVVVKNTDEQQRTARVSLRFVPKLKEPVVGIHVVPPESRQQLWVSRPVQHANLASNEEKTFEVMIRMCQASVYDVGTNHLQVDAQFEGLPMTSFKVPRVLTIINSV